MRISSLAQAALRAAVVSSVALLAGGRVLAGPEVTPEQFPDYDPAHTVIKCPYIPEEFEGKPLPTCHEEDATCIGTEGHDVIIGTDKDDVIMGLGGHDIIHADAGDDLVCGGPGNDSLMGARGADRLYGEDGDDWLFGAPEDDTLDGGPGDFDVLWGGPGHDHLAGGPGDHDVCMLQREMGEFKDGGCDTIYPPPGYVHDEEPDPGVLRKAEPLKLP